MLRRLTVCCLLFSLVAVAQAAPKIRVLQDVESGIYEPGKTATWTISVTDDNKPLEGKVEYTVKKGGLTDIDKGSADLKDGKAEVKATRDDPGTLLVTVKYKPSGAAKEIVGHGGAAFAPDKIKASAPPPDDFDEFWKKKIAELDAIPMNVQIEPVDIGDKNIEFFKVTMDNVQGKKIHGQLAKPASKSNLPTMLQVQYAGVYALHRDWVTNNAKSGWLSFNIIAHDLPIDEKEDFYKAKAGKELNDYPGIGNEDRETSYFLPMFLSCVRGVEFLKQREDWNKKTLVVTGGSQGGWQTLVTAGLCPDVTALAANVPAGCDHTGKQAGRAPGWPDWASRTWQKKDATKMLTAARYFDSVNFATHIKCDSLIGLGLSDTTCPAEGVLAACNQIQGSKKLVIMPEADHIGDHKLYYGALYGFMEKQRKGE